MGIIAVTITMLLLAIPGPVRHPLPQASDPDGLTPLMRAAARGDLAQVNALLGKGSELTQARPRSE